MNTVLRVNVLIWNGSGTDGVLQRLEGDLLRLRLLLCMGTELRVDVYLQRDDVSDTLPLRQTILI